MAFDLVIRRNADGETRRYRVDDIEWDDESTLGWLTEGNFGCDCNRFLCFERTCGRDPELASGERCGDGAYAILTAVLPDGTVIPVDNLSPQGDRA